MALFFILQILFQLSLTSALAAEEWKQLGQRWVAKLNDQSQVLAIYDLSYPLFFSRVKLGFLEKDDLDPQLLKRRIEKYLSETGAKFHPSTKSLKKMSWPKTDWKNIPWKVSSLHKIQNNSLKKFRLSDIDFDQLSNDQERFRALMSSANRIYYSIFFEEEVPEGSLSGSQAWDSIDFLDQFEYQETERGDLELYWLPSPKNPLALHSKSKFGKKIADLNSIRGGFYAGLELGAFQAILEAALGLGLTPFASAVVNTIIDRLVKYYNLQLESHQEMLMEMLAAAEYEGGSFSQIFHSDRVKIGSYIVWTETSGLDFIKRIFNPWGVESEWASILKKYQTSTLHARQWLAKNGKSSVPLGERFDLEMSGSDKKLIYISSRSEPSKNQGPSVGFDYQVPNRIVQRRIAEEFLDTEVNFATNLMPLVGFVLNQIYKLTVESKIKKSKYAESRLLAALEERQSALGEDWQQPLSVLPYQQANPLELSWEEQVELIKMRKQAISSLY